MKRRGCSLFGVLPGAHDEERIYVLLPSLESVANIEFMNRYYEGGVSSVYFWDLDDGFAGVVLLKKSMYYWAWFSWKRLRNSIGTNALETATPKGKSEGGWDSIHVFEAIDKARTAHYKLTSTVILRLSTENDALGEMDLSGSMTRQVEQDMPVQDDSSHIVNVGKLVEDMELKMRNLLRMFIRYNQLIGFAGLIMDRGGIFWEGEGCCRRPSKYDGIDKPGIRGLLTLCRYPILDGGEQGEGDTSRDDQINASMKQIPDGVGTV